MNISGLLNSQKYIQFDYQSRFTHAAGPLDNDISYVIIRCHEKNFRSFQH